MMTRRLLALMVAIVVAGAPEALEACRMICATVTPGESATLASGMTHHHAHWQDSDSSSRPALRTLPYTCGSGDALLPSAASQPVQVTVTPPIAAVLALPIHRRSTRAHATHLREKPPGVVPLVAILRV